MGAATWVRQGVVISAVRPSGPNLWWTGSGAWMEGGSSMGALGPPKDSVPRAAAVDVGCGEVVAMAAAMVMEGALAGLAAGALCGE